MRRARRTGRLDGDCEADYEFEDDSEDESGVWDEEDLDLNAAGGLC
jgi:hypothetical protein